MSTLSNVDETSSNLRQRMINSNSKDPTPTNSSGTGDGEDNQIPEEPEVTVPPVAPEDSAGMSGSNLLILFGGLTILIGVCGLSLGLSGALTSTSWPPSSCHSIYPNLVQHLSTKTPYIPKTGAGDSVVSSSASECTPSQIWLAIRHGTRNPSEEVITEIRSKLPLLRNEIMKNHEDGRGELCETELVQLTNWEVPTDLKPEYEKFLVPQGIVELRGIGKRYKQKFPNLFPHTFSNSTYKFKFTKTQRAEESAIAFANGLFDEEEVKNVWFPEAMKADPVLRFYKACPKWIKNVDKNPVAYEEKRKFERSESFQNMISRVSTRLGYPADKELETENVRLMYVMCGFETSWNGGLPSPWCNPFHKEDLRVLEYHQDVEYYWIDGYGYPITVQAACPAVRDVITHFERKTNSRVESPNVIAYFTHSGTLLKLISRFGLFKDKEPLLGHNYGLHKERQWRTSNIDKFATNLGFVLHTCPNDKYRVSALFQEEIVPLEACGGKEECSLDEFKAHFEQLVHDCDLDKLCKL